MEFGGYFGFNSIEFDCCIINSFITGSDSVATANVNALIGETPRKRSFALKLGGNIMATRGGKKKKKPMRGGKKKS